jgi:hypothetical protein
MSEKSPNERKVAQAVKSRPICEKSPNLWKVAQSVKSRPICAKVAQSVQKSPNLCKSRPICAKVAQSGRPGARRLRADTAFIFFGTTSTVLKQKVMQFFRQFAMLAQWASGTVLLHVD